MLQLNSPAGRCFSYTGLLLVVFFCTFFTNSVWAFPQHDVLHEPATTKTYVIGEISLSGNKVTKPDIIFREIIFNSGDTIPHEKLSNYLSKSRENLLNTALFNFVEVETLVREENTSVVDVSFHFVERWYIWPIPIVELADRNFNEWWETRDFSRLNYGLYLNHNNFRGRRELLQALFLTGYSQSFALSYLKPNLNREQTIGLGFNASYNRRREVAYATQNDQLVYFHDPKGYSLQSFSANVLFYYRPRIHQSHSTWLQFNRYIISDTVFSLNPGYFIENITEPHFLSLVYEFRNDRRNLKYYPTSGFYYDLVLARHGLGIFQNTNLNVFNVSTTYKRYFELRPRWFMLTGASVRLSFTPDQPYFMNRSLGYMYDFVRGYEYYVINGRHAGLLKTNLKYQLLPTRVYRLPFIRTEKFSKLHLSLYLGVHSDVGFVQQAGAQNENSNRLPNRLLWGNGIGLDIVTYYDRVMRMEYSVNRMGEHGFFLHFLAPI